MRITLLSDAHLEGPDDPVQAELVGLLGRIQTDELVLLGDLFAAWWAGPGQFHAAYAPLLAALRALVARGVVVSFVPGNHDFHAGPALCGQVGLTWGDPWRRTVEGRRYHAEHGDRADRSVGMRGLHLVLRSRVVARAVRVVGPERAWAMALRWSRRDRVLHDPTWILEAQRVHADRLLDAGADVVCFGHAHAPGVERRASGLLVNLGDWRAHRSLAVIDGEVTVCTWLDGRLEPILGIPQRRLPLGSIR